MEFYSINPEAVFEITKSHLSCSLLGLVWHSYHLFISERKVYLSSYVYNSFNLIFMIAKELRDDVPSQLLKTKRNKANSPLS